MKKNKNKQNKVAGLRAIKKLYKTPELTRLGSVRSLTLGSGSLNYDEGSLVEDLE